MSEPEQSDARDHPAATEHGAHGPDGETLAQVVFAAVDPERTVIEAMNERLGKAPRLRLREDSAGTPDPTAELLARAPGAGKSHYRILHEIDRGGMGIVMRGHDENLGRDVAVKILNERAAEDPGLLRRFIEEAQVGGQLQHPGIVPVYELGLMADERPYFTMKLVQGQNLSDLLAERTSPTADRRRFLAVFESICQTMGYAHHRGVIHRDLKPANVMVGEFGEVQLVDWGLAKVLTEVDGSSAVVDTAGVHTVRSESESPSADSLFGSVMGTLAYMSPEQARGQVDALDERTDVFALGGILCKILTGQAPYPGLERRELHRAALPEQAELRARLDASDADGELLALARDCLAPEPADRPADARAVATRMAAYLAGVEERARAAQIEAAEARVKAAEERRARRLTLGLAASIVSTLLLGAAAWAWLQMDRAGRRQQTEERVAAALGQAAFARGRSEWGGARTAIERARAHLQSGTADTTLAARVDLEATVLARAYELALAEERLLARRREFRARLETIRTRVARTNEHKIAGYAAAFADHDIALDATDEAVAAAIRGSGMPLELARALTDWARLVRDSAGERSDEARRLLTIALAVDDDALRSRTRRALLAEDAAQLDRIATEEAGRLSPLVAVVLADALWWLGERVRAQEILAEAEQRHPEDFHLQIKLAARHLGLLELDEALPYLRAARSLEPRNSWVLASLGVVYIEAGRDTEALASAQRAVEVDPDDAYAHLHLGRILAALEHPDEALVHLRRAVALDPTDPFALLRLATALEERGAPREAARTYLVAHGLDPGDPALPVRAAWCLASAVDPTAREIDDALALAERGVALRGDAEALRTLGLCALRAGLFEAAVEALDRALALDPGLDDASVLRAEAAAALRASADR